MARPELVAASVFARFCALLARAGVCGSESWSSFCSAGVMVCSAARGSGAAAILARASCKIFCTCGSTCGGVVAVASFFCAAATVAAAWVWALLSARRCASSWSIGLGSSTRPIAATATATVSRISPRRSAMGYAAVSRARAAFSSASRRSAPSIGPDSRRRSHAVERRSFKPSCRSAVRINPGELGRAAIQATATAANATGTPSAATRSACSMGTNLATITTARIQADAPSIAWSR